MVFSVQCCRRAFRRPFVWRGHHERIRQLNLIRRVQCLFGQTTENEGNNKTQAAETTSEIGQTVTQLIVLQVRVHVSADRHDGGIIAGSVGVFSRFQRINPVLPTVAIVPFGAIHFFHGNRRTFIVPHLKREPGAVSFGDLCEHEYCLVLHALFDDEFLINSIAQFIGVGFGQVDTNGKENDGDQQQSESDKPVSIRFLHRRASAWSSM